MGSLMIQKKEELSHSMLLCTHRQDFALFKRKVDSGERKKKNRDIVFVSRGAHTYYRVKAKDIRPSIQILIAFCAAAPFPSFCQNGFLYRNYYCCWGIWFCPVFHFVFFFFLLLLLSKKDEIM